MSTPWPILDDEAERLETLRELEAGPKPEERYDRITRMATRTLAVPIVLVSLIEQERQWFKSRMGLDQLEVPRSESICAYTLAGSGALVVADLRADPRFQDYPIVTGPPYVRSYAGYPLTIGGRRVGTLCVMDTRKRSFDDNDLAALNDLAAWAESELVGERYRRVVLELDALQRRTEMVLGGVAEGVIGVDAIGRITFVNRAAEEMLGWPRRALIGLEMHSAVHHRRSDGTPYPISECPVSDTLRQGREHRLLRETFWRRDGTGLPVDWSAGAVIEAGTVAGAVVVFEDATRRIEMDRIKDEFVSVVSHELRTPLTSLRGALDLLAAGLLGEGAGPDAHRLVTIAHQNAGRLARLIDDILDLDRSSRGALPLSRTLVDLPALLEAAVATVQGTADAARVRLSVDCAVGCVWGDEHRLLQVLTNLLGNAVRFSPPDSTVQLRCSTDQRAVRISVADQGVGIAADKQDRVFDRFWQVDASDTRARSGSGLGLAIAKNIVESHGGWISLDSAVGVGSTFTVYLPLRARAQAVEADRRSTSTSERGSSTDSSTPQVKR